MRFSFTKEKIKNKRKNKKINFWSRRSMHLKLCVQSQLAHLIWDGSSHRYLPLLTLHSFYTLNINGSHHFTHFSYFLSLNYTFFLISVSLPIRGRREYIYKNNNDEFSVQKRKQGNGGCIRLLNEKWHPLSFFGGSQRRFEPRQVDKQVPTEFRKIRKFLITP